MTRSATHWHVTTDRHGRRIEYITSDECTVSTVCLVSVRDPHSDLPSRRMVRNRETCSWERQALDDGAPETGLIVYGICKWDRPDLDEAYQLDRVAADAIKAAAGNA